MDDSPHPKRRSLPKKKPARPKKMARDPDDFLIPISTPPDLDFLGLLNDFPDLPDLETLESDLQLSRIITGQDLLMSVTSPEEAEDVFDSGPACNIQDLPNGPDKQFLSALEQQKQKVKMGAINQVSTENQVLAAQVENTPSLNSSPADKKFVMEVGGNIQKATVDGMNETVTYIGTIQGNPAAKAGDATKACDPKNGDGDAKERGRFSQCCDYVGQIWGQVTSLKAADVFWGIVWAFKRVAIDFPAWIFRNPAFALFLVEMLQQVKHDICRYMSLRLGMIGLQKGPAKVYDFMQNTKAFVRVFVVPTISMFFNSTMFSSLWDSLSSWLGVALSGASGALMTMVTGALGTISGVGGALSGIVSATTGFLTEWTLKSMKHIVVSQIQMSVGKKALFGYFDFLKDVFVGPCLVEVKVGATEAQGYLNMGWLDPNSEEGKQLQKAIDEEKNSGWGQLWNLTGLA